MDKYSFLNTMNLEFIDNLYKKYKNSPDIIELNWRYFFQGFDFALENYNIKKNNNYKHKKKQIDDLNDIDDISKYCIKKIQVFNLINSYKSRGHLFTNNNPIKNRPKYIPNLDLNNFGLSESDLDTIFDVYNIIGFNKSKLKHIIFKLKKIYCESIGIEYLHINDNKIIDWIQKWININDNHPNFPILKKKEILKNLNKAICFEHFLHKKFIGQKRFSIEGNESLLPGIIELIEYATTKYDIKEYIIGMAHRGRLNILSNILGKKNYEIFNEFESKNLDINYINAPFYGDVKYHLGYTVNKNILNKNIKIQIIPNPSHLEAVNPIVEGIVRAKIDNIYNNNKNKIIPILIHGDAAIAGQGIVYETIQMSELPGYTTGGSIHIIINNQLGFTTDDIYCRSSIYCTDIAKILNIPILHVNADDVEAVIHALFFAIDFRMYYNKDVFIDLLGYRKYGHNEGDEPRFTQLSLYKKISIHPNARDIYNNKLEKENIINKDFIKNIKHQEELILNKSYEDYKNIKINKQLNNCNIYDNEYNNIIKNPIEIFKNINTKFSLSLLLEINKKINTLPKDKKFYLKIKKLLNSRLEMVNNKNYVNWAIAELLAYGSLLYEGYNIRLSGEDVERGTFSHRHIVIKSEDDKKIILLNNILKKQGKINIYNSILSEYGVLGFDYGYAMSAKNTLTLWEAQFGDFSNVAQVIIDQYISSAEDKWQIQNGIVLLLPHGYEGQGAEHSSARIERYLQLCSNYNIILTNCTTPANFFHLLRRHMKFNFRKPLIIFTPKSLLRHKKCISNIKELSQGKFQEIIDDNLINPEYVNKIIFCSGKIYYEILAKKELLIHKNIAIIRIEQLYPLNKKLIKNIINKYYNHKYLFWVQEEPENMGAWSYMIRTIQNLHWILISPKDSATTAPGSNKDFLYIQNKIINKIFQY